MGGIRLRWVDVERGYEVMTLPFVLASAYYLLRRLFRIGREIIALTQS